MRRVQPPHPRPSTRSSRPAPWRSLARLVATILVLVVVAACGDASQVNADDHDTPAVYIALIRSLAPDGASVLPKAIFVEALPGTKLSLEDQASVVKAFGDDNVVRFIDARDEAVDDKGPGAPVRRDGVLLQMHPAQTTTRGLSVKTVRYTSRTDEHTSCVELESSDDEWQVVSALAC